jgi:hypothetical protein
MTVMQLLKLPRACSPRFLKGVLLNRGPQSINEVRFYSSYRLQKIYSFKQSIWRRLKSAQYALNSQLCHCAIGISDFDAQISGIKLWKGDENLRPVNKKPFYEVLSG